MSYILRVINECGRKDYHYEDAILAEMRARNIITDEHQYALVIRESDDTVIFDTREDD